MSEELIKVFDYFGEKFGIIIDWTSENALPYVHDLLHRIVAYNIVCSSIQLFFSIICATIVVLLIRYGIKKDNDKQACWYWDEDGFWVSVLCVVLSILCIVFFCVGISNLLTNIFIPEKAILDMTKSMM